MVGIFGKQLRALGHECVWEVENSRFITMDRGYNLIVEGFVPGVIKALKDAHERGARFICLATEEPTDKGFNHGLDKEMVMRQKNFIDAAPYLDGILHTVPGDKVTAWYGQYAPSAPVELGYAPDLTRFDGTEPTYEFGFFGSMSKRRLAILKKLADRTGKKKAIRIVANFPPQDERDKIMREAKVIVQLRKFDQMELVSSSRCNTALHLGRPVIAEPHEHSHPWDEVIKFSRDMEWFYRDAMIMKDYWRGEHRTQFEKFKTKFSPELCAGESMRRIGIQV